MTKQTQSSESELPQKLRQIMDTHTTEQGINALEAIIEAEKQEAYKQGGIDELEAVRDLDLSVKTHNLIIDRIGYLKKHALTQAKEKQE